MKEFIQVSQAYQKNLTTLLEHPEILEPLFARERKAVTKVDNFTSTEKKEKKEGRKKSFFLVICSLQKNLGRAKIS
jgi:hypothetical protein